MSQYPSWLWLRQPGTSLPSIPAAAVTQVRTTAAGVQVRTTAAVTLGTPRAAVTAVTTTATVTIPR